MTCGIWCGTLKMLGITFPHYNTCSHVKRIMFPDGIITFSYGTWCLYECKHRSSCCPFMFWNVFLRHNYDRWESSYHVPTFRNALFTHRNISYIHKETNITTYEQIDIDVWTIIHALKCHSWHCMCLIFSVFPHKKNWQANTILTLL